MGLQLAVSLLPLDNYPPTMSFRKKNTGCSSALSSSGTYITQLITDTWWICDSGDLLQIYAKYIHFV